jgi:hypothetical protein
MNTLYRCTALLSLLSFFSNNLPGQDGNAPVPEESYFTMTIQPPVSTIAIPVNIPAEEMNRTINSSLPYVLYDDNSFAGDNLMVRATRSAKKIELTMSGNTIRYNVPVRLWVKQNLYVSTAEAEGEINLGMRTTYTLNPNWTLKTQTTIDYHEWLQKPVLRTGLGNVGIETLANLALNQSKASITKSIDDYVSEQLSLRPYVEEAWTALQEPILLDESYQMWVKTTPKSIGMTPIQADSRGMRANISVDCINEVTFGSKPYARINGYLPNLTILPENAPDVFRARMAVNVPFQEAERLAKMHVEGQEFASGKRSVTVNDVKLWGDKDKLVVKTNLSGSFNGNIYFTGRPVFNRKSNQIEVEDLDFHLETKNFLHRSAAWLFGGPIKNQMRKAMTFPLKENLDYMRQSAQESLRHYEIHQGVILSGTVDDVTIDETLVQPSGFLVLLSALGKLKVDVAGL